MTDPQAIAARLSERERRTLTDPQRLLWRDDVESVCPNPAFCFEDGGTVRCGPCAIKQAAALGIASNMGLPNLPEVSRLKRELAAVRSILGESNEG